MFEALQLFHQRVDFDELLQRSARTSKPVVKPIVIREKAKNLMVVSLQKLIDDSGMKSTA
jgi:hypothetical protein